MAASIAGKGLETNDTVYDDFSDAFSVVQKELNHLKFCYDNTVYQIEKFVKTCPHVNIEQFLPKDTQERVQRVITTQPAIIVIGQSNCGKSSLINEILRGSILPTAEVPCTSKIVRLKHSREPYFQELDKDGNCIEGKPKETLTKKLKVPRSVVAVPGAERNDKSKVEGVVEVGFDHPLLEKGISIVDAPGFSENATLDSLVTQCVEGILGVIIYVIDGQHGVRQQDRKKINELRKKVPRATIFYVCNKVEVNEKALRMDQTAEEADLPRETPDKAAMTFKALAHSGLLDSETNTDDNPFFAAVSVKDVHRSRKRGQNDERFQQFKIKFLKLAVQTMHSHTIDALLSVVDMHNVLFYGMCGSPTQRALLSHFMAELKKHSFEFFDKTKKAIKIRKSVLVHVVKKTLADNKHDIIRDAMNMNFLPIVGDTVRRNEIILQCREQIEDHIVIKCDTLIRAKMAATFDEINKICQRDLRDVLVHIRDALGYSIWHDIMGFQQSILTCLNFTDRNVLVLTETMFDKLKENALTFLEYMQGLKVTKEWKTKVAENIFSLIDPSETANGTVNLMKRRVASAREHFEQTLKNMDSATSAIGKLSPQEQRSLEKVSPIVAQNSCMAMALLNNNLYGLLEFGETQSTSDKSQVRLVTNPAQLVGRYGEFAYVGKMVQATDLHLLPPNVAMGFLTARLLPHNANVLHYLDVVITTEFQPVLIRQRYTINLMDAVQTTKCIQEKERKRILNDVIQGLEHVLYFAVEIDLKPTHVVTCSQKDARERQWKILLGPRETSNVYPNGYHPFHLPPEAFDKSSVGFGEHQYVYSLGILLWLLFNPEYAWPEFARPETSRDDFILAVDEGNKRPDATKCSPAAQKLFERCWNADQTRRPNIKTFIKELTKIS
ncbi:dual serine/threonine and tyrosine protein kinase [Lingula anatina]|uniref:Dual serine/threonine and tyrosine protein kinase n=1 Tax=Lingula anatina TaxID=7574 RepID=A0A1S3JVD8_LINAN|nr:dual serine/threonine and tyrosine protein kinase [Lingula anatina]|eukprot:XP_013414054.1 dual serine/threonine and tyrosine protein kinase [Lingula anatina]